MRSNVQCQHTVTLTVVTFFLPDTGFETDCDESGFTSLLPLNASPSARTSGEEPVARAFNQEPHACTAPASSARRTYARTPSAHTRAAAPSTRDGHVPSDSQRRCSGVRSPCRRILDRFLALALPAYCSQSRLPPALRPRLLNSTMPASLESVMLLDVQTGAGLEPFRSVTRHSELHETLPQPGED